jgi:hypothetical protein
MSTPAVSTLFTITNPHAYQSKRNEASVTTLLPREHPVPAFLQPPSVSHSVGAAFTEPLSSDGTKIKKTAFAATRQHAAGQPRVYGVAAYTAPVATYTAPYTAPAPREPSGNMFSGGEAAVRMGEGGGSRSEGEVALPPSPLSLPPAAVLEPPALVAHAASEFKKLSGTHFTCFTGTTVQILTQLFLRDAAGSGCLGLQA